MPLTVAIFDFGGVILESPFITMRALEQRRALPKDTLTTLLSTNADTNALARFERGAIDLDTFQAEIDRESRQLGVTLDGLDVLASLAGDPREEMLLLLDELALRGIRTVLMTTNFGGQGDELLYGGRADILEAKNRFGTVLDLTLHGTRKPERRAFEIALEVAGAAPEECVYLDDLGTNLKVARRLGMHTIKVEDPAQARRDLFELF